MCSHIGLVRIFVTLEAGSLNDVVEHIANIAVNLLLRDLTTLHTLNDALNLLIRTGLHQVVTSLNSLNSTCLVAPVGHNDTVEAPLIAQYAGQKTVRLLSILTIELVVRRHNSPRLSLTNCNLEALEVELAKSTNVNTAVVLHTVGLLVVYSVVLNTNTYTIALDTLNVSSSNLTGEQRILREVLKVTTAQGVTVKVHTGSQKYVSTILQNLLTHSGSYTLNECGVPSTCQYGTYGETSTVVSVGIIGASGVDTQTSRAVSQYGCGDTQTLNRTGSTSSTRYENGARCSHTTCAHATPTCTYKQSSLLLEGHRLDDLLNIVSSEFGLCYYGSNTHQSCNNRKYFFHFVCCFS